MDHSKYFELGGGYMQTHIANMILDLKKNAGLLA